MTLAELREYSNTKLASDSDITAVEHREVNNAIFDFLQTILPLASGSFSIGNVIGPDDLRTVTFPDIGTTNYYVSGILRYGGTDYNKSNDVITVVGEFTRTSFKLGLREIFVDVQNLFFDWEIKLKN